VTAAWAAVRVETSYLHARFLRIKATLAVAASMLAAAYHMSRAGVEYADLGADYFSRHHTGKTIQRLLRCLTDLGCKIPGR
jgi:transposase